jgi:F-type H+-transporting ATPase subunit b
MNDISFVPLAYAEGANTTVQTEAATEATAKAAESGGLKIEPTTIAFQAFNFLVLLALLNLILYKPITKLLADREKRIRDGVENAEKADGMLKESNEVRQEMLKRTSVETQDMMEKARKSGEELKNGIVLEARGEADKIIKSGHSIVELEKEKASMELKAKAVNLILAATEKVLREKLDAQKDAKLIEESLQGYSA